MTSEYAVTAIGRDRPGIVAALSGALLELGGNIEDSRMSILGGHFAVMLIVELPSGSEASALEAAIEGVRDELGLEAVSVSPVENLERGGEAATHTLTVYGADRPGIVHAAAAALARLGVNVTDLSTQVTSGDTPLYVMVMELALGEVEEAEARSALAAATAEIEVDVSLRAIEAQAL